MTYATWGDDDLKQATQEGFYDGFQDGWTQRVHQLMRDMAHLDKPLQKRLLKILRKPLDDVSKQDGAS